MTGLVVYLAGPGRSNEHENPHVVAGHDTVMYAARVGELSHEDAIGLAGKLDTARVVFGTEVVHTNRRQLNAAIDDGTPRAVALADATSDRNVWHCSLSLNPDEGELSDEKWGVIASDFMREMGFDEPDSPRASARWVAIRHGKTVNGGDHIHIAASAVREDGTKVDTYNDFIRAQAACNMLEHRHQLVVLTSRENERGTRGLKPAEAHRAQRDGRPETTRETLERTVRACATASKTEDEFVRRLRAWKVLARPRYATGRTDEVVGYSVAATPTAAQRAAGQQPVWYGGGRLAKDLTLTRLRDEWQHTDDTRTAALAEWSASNTGARVAAATGREHAHIDPALVARAASDIEKWNTYLTSIPAEDTAQWARAAGRTSGVFAAWSARVEATPGPLAATSAALAKSAQIPAYKRHPVPPGSRSAGGAALILLQLTTTDAGAGYLLLLRQLTKTVEAIADAHRAAGDLARARALETTAWTQLVAVHRRLERTRAEAPIGAVARSVPARSGATRVPQSTAQERRLAYSAAVDARTDLTVEQKQALKALRTDSDMTPKPGTAPSRTVPPEASPGDRSNDHRPDRGHER